MTPVLTQTQMAFRKADDDWFAAAVRWRTGSIYSHVEIVVQANRNGSHRCFSASWMDGGVRQKNIVLDPAKWDVLPVHINPERLVRVMGEETGRKYDRIGILAWGTPLARLQEGRKWFCSELCAHVIGLDDPWRYSPGSLHAAVRAMR